MSILTGSDIFSPAKKDLKKIQAPVHVRHETLEVEITAPGQDRPAVRHGHTHTEMSHVNITITGKPQTALFSVSHPDPELLIQLCHP